MKVDRVVLAWDGNPRYDGFYEMHQRLWPKLGIKLGLVYVCDGSNISKRPREGDIRDVEDRSSVPYDKPPGRNWKATMALIHAPRLFPGEVTMVMNMDQFPASMRLIRALEQVGDDEMGTAYCPVSHICTTEVAAHHNVWELVMKPAPKDFTDLLEWTWQLKLDLKNYEGIATGWGADEVVLSQLAQKSGVTVRPAFLDAWGEWLDRVLGITGIVPNQEWLKAGYYSNLHIRLPLSDLDRKTFNQLVEMDKFPGLV